MRSRTRRASSTTSPGLSNDQQDVKVEKLELRIPVMEQPGALGGLVQAPAQEGSASSCRCRPGSRIRGNRLTDAEAVCGPVRGEPAAKPGTATVRGRTLTARFTCAASADSCKRVGGPGRQRRPDRQGRRLCAGSEPVPDGQDEADRPRREAVQGPSRRHSQARQEAGPYDSGARRARATVLISGRRSGSVTIRRVGTVR